MPATPDTIGSIGRKRLGLMKQTAFLINVARAEIIDEDALYKALARRSIAGAALDVWYRYPREAGSTAPATRPFHELPNVLMTPHVSGWTDGMIEARAKLIAEKIRRISCGETPLILVRLCMRIVHPDKVSCRVEKLPLIPSLSTRERGEGGTR